VRRPQGVIFAPPGTRGLALRSDRSSSREPQTFVSTDREGTRLWDGLSRRNPRLRTLE
jgi:hypothetical protein